MVIYLINIFSLFLWYLLYKKYENEESRKIYILIGICLQFIIIQGLRDFSIGSDTIKYMKYYNYIKQLNTNLWEIIVNPPLAFETGYLILMKIFTLLGANDRVFLIGVTIILNVLIFRFILKKSDNIILSLWLFICTEYYTLSFTMLRQMIAIGCILNAYIYIEERKIKHFTIFTIVGCLFHKTAICFMPIYFILNKEDFLNKNLCAKIDEIYKKYKLWIWSGCAVFSVVTVPYIYDLCYKSFYPYYQKAETEFNFPTLAVLMFGVLLLSYWFERYFYIQEKEYFNYQSCLFFAFLLQLCTFKSLYLGRVALYFYVFIIILIPSMINYIENKKFKKLVIISVMALSFIQYTVFSMNIYNMVPYSIGEFW